MKERIRTVERFRLERLSRDRQNFLQFLRGLDREGKRRFFERVMRDLSQPLPPWPHSISPFDLNVNDFRVQEWLTAFYKMEFGPRDRDAVDAQLYKLARSFKHVN